MDAGIIAVEVSTMPARHRERYSSSLRNLSTITPESCPPSNGITVHDALESPSTMSRNNQLGPANRGITKREIHNTGFFTLICSCSLVG